MRGTDNQHGFEAGLSFGGGPAFLSTGHKEATKMVTTTTDRAEVFSRPSARFDADGNIEVRASAALGCRRALWYAATGYQPTNPPSEESLTAMEAGNALEPVVARAMERAGWQVDPADSQDPQQVAVRVGPNMIVTGHPDGTVRTPLSESLPPTGSGDEAADPQLFLFGDESAAPAHGNPMVVEIKTRGPEAFKRWRTLGAERSHPASVAQAAFYTLGEFGEMRDAVIATMDTGSRTWDHEVIPAARLERALQEACEWLGELAAHLVLNGPDTDALPERDFSSGSWQCRSCPFLDICLPGAEEVSTEAEVEEGEVSDDDARDAVAAYAESQGAMKEPERAKRAALNTLKAWMRRQGDTKATIGGHKISLVTSKRYSVNYRKLNELLEPDVRAELVTESESEYVRVS